MNYRLLQLSILSAIIFAFKEHGELASSFKPGDFDEDLEPIVRALKLCLVKNINPEITTLKILDPAVSEETINELLFVEPNPSALDEFIESFRKYTEFRRLQRLLLGVQKRIQSNEDPVTILDQLKTDLMAGMVDIGDEECTTMEQLSIQAADKVDRGEDIVESPSIQLPYKVLNTILHGLYNGNLITIAAGPGCGKSSMATDILSHVAMDQNLNVVLFSLEMTPMEVYNRTISARTELTRHQLSNSSQLSNTQIAKLLEVIQACSTSKVIYEKCGLTTTEHICNRSIVHKLRNRLDLLIVDYAQLIKRSSPKQNPTEGLTEFTHSMKQLAMQLDVPVIILSQFNREGIKRGGRPTLEDLYGSSSIEQDSNVVMLLHNPSNNINEETPTIEIIIAKNRNGDVTVVPMQFHKKYTTFRDV